jgi:alkylation response protein AidB-like acyl-CoA dehydrogenase
VFIDLTDEQRRLRDELRVYLGRVVTPAQRAVLLRQRHGPAHRELVARLGRDGWLGLGFPVEYGGRGLGPAEQQIFVNEAARADVPLPAVTLQTVAPTLLAHGTAEQKDYFLPRILAGELHFAIGYTEPEAGTDLAALRTRAVRRRRSNDSDGNDHDSNSDGSNSDGTKSDGSKSAGNDGGSKSDSDGNGASDVNGGGDGSDSNDGGSDNGSGGSDNGGSDNGGSGSGGSDNGGSGSGSGGNDGDEYVVDGQKTFTTGAHDADFLWLACRTDPDAPRHRGLSILIVNTDDPGYTWAPIITCDGTHHVNSTYLSGVRVPVNRRVGAENDGWRLLTTQLNHERVMLGPAGRLGALLDRVRAWAYAAGVSERADVRRAVARAHAAHRVNELLNGQVAGAAPGPADASATKVFASERLLALGQELEELVWRHGDPADPATAELLDWLDLHARRDLVLTFGGGVNEIQREIIASAGLGLPRVPR